MTSIRRGLGPLRRLLPGRLAALAGAALMLGAASAASQTAAGGPDRIVSLGGAVTEILYELGLGARVVAVDTTSVHPADALATKRSVGYLRQLSAEGILSVRPTLVIAAEGAGPPDALALVRGAGVSVASVPDATEPAGVVAKIRRVAELVGRDVEGRALADRAALRFAELERARGRVSKPVRALFVLSLQNGRALVGGRGTTADGMFALAGAENAAAAVEGFKPMSDEAIIAAAPEIVVGMASGPGGAHAANLLAGAALAQTPAGRSGRLVVMDGLYLLGFGPRTPEAARDLMRALYPGLQVE